MDEVKKEEVKGAAEEMTIKSFRKFLKRSAKRLSMLKQHYAGLNDIRGVAACVGMEDMCRMLRDTLYEKDGGVTVEAWLQVCLSAKGGARMARFLVNLGAMLLKAEAHGC